MSPGVIRPYPSNYYWIYEACHEKGKTDIGCELAPLRQRTRHNGCRGSCERVLEDPPLIVVRCHFPEARCCKILRVKAHEVLNISESEGVTHQIEADTANGRVKHILDEDTLRILMPHCPSFHQCKACLHEEDECSGHQSPDDFYALPCLILILFVICGTIL